MAHNNFAKGSEWGLWDLHVHTPCSVLNNEFGSNWDDYVKNLFKKAIGLGIVAIGITDYYSIEGYKKLQNDYLKNRQKLESLFDSDEIEYINRIFIFPNIEFRIDKLVIGKDVDLAWNRKVNFHLLMSNEVKIEDIEQDLLSNLKFETNGVENGNVQKNSMTRRNFEEFGKELKTHHSKFNDHPDDFVGMVNASVNVDNLIETLKNQAKKFQGKYLFGLPADEDLSNISWNSGGHFQRKALIQKSHLIFSSNENTKKFCLGGFHSSLSDFEKEFISLKPCVWGSDAHVFDKLFIPDNDRFTWIKSNPTFEGLKQLIYEPNERVKIQQSKPSEKTPYLVIDKVRFIDKSGQNIFSPEWVELNENLNVVIGGKSSGKSLFLYHIAKAIDPNQVRDKVSSSTSDYDKFIKENPFELEVLWKSGQSDFLVESETKVGQITYIPQLYINHLVEKNGESQLFDLIESILLQNDLFVIYKNAFEEEKRKLKGEINGNINRILELRALFYELDAKIRSYGTIEQINGEKSRLSQNIEDLKKQSGLSSQEIEEMRLLENKKQMIEKEFREYTDRYESLKSFKIAIEENQKITIRTVKSRANDKMKGIDTILDLLIENLTEGLKTNLDKSYENFYTDINNEIDNIDILLVQNKKNLSDTEQKLKPLQTKAKNKELLEKTIKLLQQEENKLTELTNLKIEKERIISAGHLNNEELFNNYTSLLNLYQGLVEELNKPIYKKIGENLVLSATLNFDIKLFSDSFSNLFDRRANFKNVFDGRFDEYDNFIFYEVQHVSNIKIIFDKIRKEKELPIRFKTSINPDEKYERLFEDYFKINYSIEHKGDDILSMSPGKRGLVLLQLILHISNAKHPILIDQPEDNLDNRTIFDELKHFIKEKKSSRQMIIVTHNANLVVSTDAENIIIANQSGQQIGKDNKMFKFEYISGGLENSFLKEQEQGILYQLGVREHVCDILEGGRDAFKKREQKYGFTNL